MLAALCGAWGLPAGAAGASAAPVPPVSAGQREAAERVAQGGVDLADLMPDAPPRYTVQRGDTLWSLARLFLKSPWRWPQLWGMNLPQLPDPHRIFPGQTLVLVRSEGRARLELARGTERAAPAVSETAGEPLGTLPTVRAVPQVRAQALPALPIAPVSAREIAPFLSETVVLEAAALAAAPRIVGARDGRLLLSQGDTAYAVGELGEQREFRVFREPVPLRDPLSGEVLGYEARFVGRARAVGTGGTPATGAGAKAAAGAVPVALKLTQTRLEATIGDRLAPAVPVEWVGFVPHAPAAPVEAHVVSIAAEGMSASPRQLVAVNRGTRDGLARGHVLALWRAGERRADPAGGPAAPALQWPDERHGTVMLVHVFERVSYALVLDGDEPVRVGDRLTRP